MKEESISIEYVSSIDEATLVFTAESETSLARIELLRPDGRPALRMGAGDDETFRLQGFNIEAREVGIERLMSIYPEGRYDMRAWTVDGHRVSGSAQLRHELPSEPVLVYPYPGADDVPTNLAVGWMPVENAVRYQVILEQNENDGLTVELPSDCNSLQVPPGVLASGTPTLVEVGAIGPNGNTHLAEVNFTTR